MDLSQPQQGGSQGLLLILSHPGLQAFPQPGQGSWHRPLPSPQHKPQCTHSSMQETVFILQKSNLTSTPMPHPLGLRSHSGHQRGLGDDDQPRMGALGHHQASPSRTSDVTARVPGAWDSGSSPSIRQQSDDPPTGQHLPLEARAPPSPIPSPSSHGAAGTILWSFPHGLCP